MSRQAATSGLGERTVPKFTGKKFVLAGKLRQWTNEDATRRLKAEGGKVVAKLAEDVAYLVIGEARGARPSVIEKQALKLRKQGSAIQIVDEAGFYRLFSPSRDEALAMLTGGETGLKRWQALRANGFRVIPMPDLARVDLRRAQLPGIALFDVNLAGADLREAFLDGATLPALCQVRLDGASLVGARTTAFTDCSLRSVNLTGAHFFPTSIIHSDFTGARLRGVLGGGTQTRDASFKDADLQEACLVDSSFGRADFSQANLQRAELAGCDFREAVLRDASLRDADLTFANLTGADLREADLRGANRACADLTQARIEGADFENANLAGARLDRVDLSKARAAVVPPIGSAGPHIRKLGDVARKAKHFECQAEVDLADGSYVLMQLNADPTSAGAINVTFRSRSAEGGLNRPVRGDKLGVCLMNLAQKWALGRLRVESITAQGKDCPLGKKELQQLCIAAWCEAFAVDPNAAPPPVPGARRKPAGPPVKLPGAPRAAVTGSR